MEIRVFLFLSNGAPHTISPSVQSNFCKLMRSVDQGKSSCSICINVTWWPNAHFLKVFAIVLTLQSLVASFADQKWWQTYTLHLDHNFMSSWWRGHLWFSFCEHLFWLLQLTALVINCASNTPSHNCQPLSSLTQTLRKGQHMVKHNHIGPNHNKIEGRNEGGNLFLHFGPN